MSFSLVLRFSDNHMHHGRHPLFFSSHIDLPSSAHRPLVKFILPGKTDIGHETCLMMDKNIVSPVPAPSSICITSTGGQQKFSLGNAEQNASRPPFSIVNTIQIMGQPGLAVHDAGNRPGDHGLNRQPVET